jgi:hypothetical protein
VRRRIRRRRGAQRGEMLLVLPVGADGGGDLRRRGAAAVELDAVAQRHAADGRDQVGETPIQPLLPTSG